MGDSRLRVAIGSLRRKALRALLLLACVSPVAQADSPPPTTFPNTGAYTARLQSSRGNVAVIELSGDYSRNLSGQFNVEPRTEISKEFYRHYSDRYDFIVAFSNFEFSTGDAKAFYVGVKNDTRGLGMPLYDNGSYFGSRGVLQGFIDMAALSRYTLDPSDSRFEEVMRVLSHEFLHRWAAQVRFTDVSGQPSTALLGRDGAHWSFLLDSGGSVEYGNRWADNGNGTFTSKPDRQFFSPLDLYLMGMLKREEVPPFFLIRSPDVSVTRLPEAGVTVAGTRQDISIDQIISAEGARVPDADSAQKQFRIGFVLLTRPGVQPSDLQIQSVNAVRQAFETRLATLTAGKALAHVFLEPRGLAQANDPGVSDPVLQGGGATANVAAALSWLRGRQQTQGDWYDSPLTRLRDTVIAASALADVGSGDPANVGRALTWLATQSASNTDYAARRVSALSGRATEADWAQLVSSQNADGGWGVAPGYQSSPLDTALAVIALSLDPNAPRQTAARERAKAFLLSKQNTDGGWSHAVNGVSRTATTAHVIRALSTLDAAPQVTSAARFLAGRQNTDGGFGDSPSTTHDTSNVILALASVGQLGAVRAVDGFNFLHATQQPDGSWDGSVYATGLAARTLGAAQTYNWVASTLTVTPSAVRDGQRVALSMRVSNNGTVAAPAGVVGVFDGDPAAGVSIAEMPVPPLEPGQSTVVRGSWSTLNRPGNHLLTAVIDPATQATELTRTDNTATVRLAVAAAPVQPDLSLTAADVQVMPAVVNRLPTTVSVVTQLANIGQTDAIGIKVRLLMGPTPETMVVVDERIVNVLGRSSIAVTNSFQVTRPGRQLISVLVDADNVVADVDRSNNRADVQIDTVSSFDPAITAADLVVPSGQAAVGADVTLRATIHNHGTADTPPFQAVLTVTDGTTVREIDRIAVQLAAGAERTFSQPWRVDLTGPLEFRVALDPANAVSDLDRSNNEARAGFSAGVVSGPNLAVSFRDFAATPDPALEGSTVTLQAVVRNIGNQASASVPFGFYEGDPTQGGALIAPLQTVPALAAGASFTVSVQVPNLAGNADRLLFAVADPAGTLQETSRDENSAFRVLEVRALPDLAVSAGNIELSPPAPKPGDTLTVRVTLQNLGEQPASQVLVRLLDGNTTLGEQTVASLAAQGSNVLTFQFPLPAQATARTLTVVVDPANTVNEGNEANNTATRSLTVQSGSAFVSEFYFSPNGDGVKDTVEFGFRIETAAARRVHVVDSLNAVVRTFILGTTPVAEGAVTWDGRNDLGRIANDGRYRLRAVAADGSALAETETVLDTNREPILRASGTEAEFYRNLTCRAPQFNGWTTSLDEQSLFLVSQYGQQKGVFKVLITGGDMNTVVPSSFIEAGGNNIEMLTSSARGDKLAFKRLNQRLVNGQWVYSSEIWTVNGDGSSLRMLATSATTQPSDAYANVLDLVMNHEGTAVFARVYHAEGGQSIRRYPLEPAGAASQAVFDSREHANHYLYSMEMSPNRRRALIRFNFGDSSDTQLAILDFETGAFIRVADGLYTELRGSVYSKWSPDSRHLLLYGTVEDMGVEEGNKIDFEFDVFDADFNLEKRFRTNKGPGDESWYSGLITGVEWSSASDEFAFILSPRPYGGGWYGEEPSQNDWSQIDGPATTTFYKANLGQSTLTPMAVSPEVLQKAGWSSSLWWAPQDRTLVMSDDQRTHSSIHADNGQTGSLFPKWVASQTEYGQDMSVSQFAPSGRRLYFSSSRSGIGVTGGCVAPLGSTQLFAYESLQNLVTDLQPLRDPRAGGILLRGTAADLNFSGYRLEYADTRTPNEWHAVAPFSTEQRISTPLATWVPPAYGSYLVRLSVQDRAGNAGASVRRVNWNDTPPITDVMKDLDYISPNGDGVQDKLTISYRVVEPVHLTFEVKSEDGTPVRRVDRDHPAIGSNFAFEWDGRDDQGRFVPDGKYTVRVLDYEFQVEIDTVFPEVDLQASEHAFNYSVSVDPSLVSFDSESLKRAVDQIQFTPGPGMQIEARVSGPVGEPFVTVVPIGNGIIRWDGLDSDRRPVPPGSYMLGFHAAGPNSPAIHTFMVELTRDAGGVPTIVYRPVMNGTNSLPLRPAFLIRALDRLLDQDSVQLEVGVGNPPASWQSVVKDGRKESSLGVGGVVVDEVKRGDRPDGTRISQIEGGQYTSMYSRSRLRVTARDRAGNAVTVVSPYRDPRELVLFSPLPVEAMSYDLWWSLEQADQQAFPASAAVSNFSDTIIPAPRSVPEVSPNSPVPLAPDFMLRAFNLQFYENLPASAPRFEFRYTFLPMPVTEPTETDPLRKNPILPTAAELRLLQWTTVPIKGLAPTETSPGISQIGLADHYVRFNWQLPHADPGVWLYQGVAHDENGQETRSNVFFYVRSAGAFPSRPWQAYHEPSTVCDGPVSEIAHAQMLIPSVFPDKFPRVTGVRLQYIRSDGTRELLMTQPVNNLSRGVGVDHPFTTGTWALGRHNFEFELRDVHGQWHKVSSPYIYVNHTAPTVNIASPRDGAKMCVTQTGQEINGVPIGYVPFEVTVQERYAAYPDLLSQPQGQPEHPRSPAAYPFFLLGTLATILGENPDRACKDFTGACGDSGPIIWPIRPGKFSRDATMNLWGLGAKDEMLVPSPLSGPVAAMLRAYGPSGHLSCRRINIEADGYVDGFAGLESGGVFSPNGDGVIDEAVISVIAHEALTVRIVAKSRASGATVAVLADNVSQTDGTRLFPWSGRSAGGTALPDGFYDVMVTLIDGCGNYKDVPLLVEIDNTPPAIVVDSPRANAVVPTEFMIKGSISDLHPLQYEVEGVTDASPDAPINLPRLNPMNRPHVDLARWNTSGLEGRAKIRIRAYDAVGNSSSIEVPLQLSEPVSLITRLTASPDPFSPNGDGRRERVTIQYSLTRSANLTLVLVRAGSGVPIKTLLSNVPAPGGNGTVVWDGRNEAGAVEPDEDVTVQLTAEVITDGSVSARELANTTFTLDKTPPVITYTLPRGPVTTGRGGVAVAAVDPLFAEATLSISINGGAHAWMASTQEPSGALVAPLDEVPEGPISLRLQASDRAENQSVSNLGVIIDRTPPKPQINAPPANAYISGLRQQPYSIEGTIEELHLLNFQLALGPNALVEGTTLPTTPRLLNWNPLSVSDGPYTLTLRAEDRAGLTGSTSVQFTVDNTPPVALIRSTGSPMYLKLGTVLNGTATDINFERYKVELAPGGSSSNRWTEVGRGTTEIANAALTTFSVLPTDGVYGLRLTVTDKAGNESSAVQDVTVDTIPPNALTLTAELRNRRDADVRWNIASEADLAGYILYRNGSRVNTALLTTNTYLDAGLAAGTYVYTVKAVDRAGNESEPSNEGRVVVSSSEPVAQIFAPTRDAWTAGLAEVRGTAMAPADFKEYRLYIGAGANPTSWELLRRSPLAITADVLSAWNTLSLVEGAQYTLRLEAEDLSGVIATDRVTVRVKNTPPRAPLQLQGTLSGGNNIALTWTANTEPDLQGYLLYRDQQLANATGLVIGSLTPYLIRPTAYNDLAVPDGVHRYFVQAMDQAGNVSDPSNQVEFTVDTRPPHVVVTKPADGSRVSQTTVLVGESPDTDLARVQFQYRPVGNGPWVDIGAPLTENAGPWRKEWDVSSLPFGSYQVRAVGTDQGGRTDPSPVPITVIVTDLRKPDAPLTLVTRVNGGDVQLTWTASPSTFTAGYRIERVDPADPISGEPEYTSFIANLQGRDSVAYVDVNRPDARYSYRIYALSAGDVLSDPSNNAPATVFTPQFLQPYTPTTATAVTLDGETLPSHDVVLLTPFGDLVAEGRSDETGKFRFENIALELGDNRFVVLASDAQSNTSREAPWHAVNGVAPAAPTGLNPTVNSHDVTLTWAPNLEDDLEGYITGLNGTLRSGPLSPVGVAASSTLPWWNNFFDPATAIDGDVVSGWRPDNTEPVKNQWLEVQLGTQVNVDWLSLRWAAPGWVPTRYRIEGFDGEVWVPLAQVEANPEPVLDIRLAKPYRTDRVRVLLVEGQIGQIQLNELRINGLTRTATRSASYLALPDGRPRLGVVAVTSLGFLSPLSEATPTVGDVTPPDAPVLQAQAVVSDAHLSWQGPSNVDVAGFQIRRDGQLIATLNNPAARTYVDPSLPNAHYDYVVAAIDGVGNVSLPSNVAGVDISVAGPGASITAAASAPPGGGLVVVNWTVGVGAQPAAFTLSRSVVPNGPYEVIATNVHALTYDDRYVANGVRYYYVVAGTDAIGNVGAVSNEANARPNDAIPPGTPYFVLPGRAPGPVTVDAPLSTLVGFAEPGVQVMITRGGEIIGSADASFAETRRSLPVSNTVFDATPDGTLVYRPGGDDVVYSFDGTAVRSRSLSGFVPAAVRFAPDGRSAAVMRYFGDIGRQVLMRWDRATDQLTTVSSRDHQSRIEFSPDGRTLVSSAYNPSTGEPGLEFVDWQAGTQRFVPSPYSTLAWSPDGQTLAGVDAGVLHLFDPQMTRDVAVPGLQQAGSPTWLPDGSALLVESRTPAGPLGIARVNAQTLAVTPLVSDASVDLTMPVVSPDGDAYLYTRNYYDLVQRNFAGGNEMLIAQRSIGGYKPIWAADRSIYYLNSYSDVGQYVPAGVFSLPEVSLRVGSNVFGAYAVDNAGNTSAPALPLEVRRPGQGLPDWSVTTDSWFVFPATPQSGETVSLAVTVRNLGAAAPATPLSIVAIDEQGTPSRIMDGSLAALAPGAQQTIRTTWTAPQAGRYVLVAVVDPQGTTEEVSKDNNQAARQVVVTTVATAGRPELQVRTDKPSYAGGEAVATDVTAANSGTVFDGTLVARIVDTGGVELFRFDARAVQGLTYGQPQTFRFNWPTGTTYAGDYRVTAELLATGGQAAASGFAAFTLTPGANFGSSLSTDRVEYLLGDNVNVSGAVRFISGNVPTANTPAALTIATEAGEVVATRSFDLRGLLLGADAQVQLPWPASQAGPFIARLVVGSADAPASTSEASFMVVPPAAPLIAGRLQVAGDVFTSTETIQTTSSVTNRGAIIDPLSVRVRAYDPTTGQTLATWAGDLRNLGAVPVVTPAALSGTWPLASFELRLEAMVGGQWMLLDRARVQAAERTPPGVAFVSPTADAIVRSTATVTTYATARQAPIARVEMASGGGWSTMPPQDAGAGLYYSNALPATDGPVTLQARATDTLANVSSIVTLPIVIDNTPPLITVTGVTDQQVSPTPLTPVISVTDLHLLGSTITLDGAPYVSGTPVGLGVHTLAIDAVDRADNRSSTTVRFTVQPLSRVTGTLNAPATVTLGDVAALGYGVTNGGANPLTDLPVIVRISDMPSGTVRASYPLAATLPAGETQVGTVNWTASGEAGQVMVTLSATVDGRDAVLAQSLMQVLAPPADVDLVATPRIAKDPRALVLVACRNAGVDDPACLQQRIAAITTMLHLKGIPFQIVTTEAEFEAQFRCGTYNFYWISGSTHLLLSEQTTREIREAVRRGDGLFVEGEQPWDGEVVRSTAGASKYDWFEEGDRIAEVLPGFGFEAGPLQTLGVPARLVTNTGAERIATFDGYLTAMARNRVGLGGASIMGFDYAAMLAAPGGTGNARLQAMLDSTLGHSAFAPSLLTLGDAVRLSTEVRNRGTQAVDVEARATLPDGVFFMDAEPLATQFIPASSGTTAQVVWQFTLQPGASIDLKLRQRLDTETPTTVQVPVEIFSRPAAGSPVLRTTATHELPVAQGLALNYAARAAFLTLAVTGDYEQSLLGYANTASEAALQDFLIGEYALAISKWVTVSNLIGEITTEEPTKLAAVQQAVAMAIEAATDRLCRP